jgi:hypothetical protein
MAGDAIGADRRWGGQKVSHDTIYRGRKILDAAQIVLRRTCLEISS